MAHRGKEFGLGAAGFFGPQHAGPEILGHRLQLPALLPKLLLDRLAPRDFIRQSQVQVLKLGTLFVGSSKLLLESFRLKPSPIEQKGRNQYDKRKTAGRIENEPGDRLAVNDILGHEGNQRKS